MLDIVTTVLSILPSTLAETVFDVAPIIAILLAFQFLVLRRKVPHFPTVCIGFGFVLVGLTLFLVGLGEALFPLGRSMAMQLTEKAALDAAAIATTGITNGITTGAIAWHHYTWVYVFAAAIGFATTIAEPALIAVSLKASEFSGGSLSSWGLRIAVAVGVAVGVALGTLRIVTGWPLHYFIMAGYGVVIIQTFFARKWIIPLAYDSGGVTTSTVTVPLVAALGLGLASAVPGRSPLIDGFGLITFASLFPIMTVMGYALLGDWRERRGRPPEKEEKI